MSTKLRTLKNETEWIDLISPSEPELQQAINKYKLDEYQVVNWMKPDQLPSYEKVGDSYFIMSRLYTINTQTHRLHTMQELTDRVAIFYSEKFLVTIHRDALKQIDEHVGFDEHALSNQSPADVLALLFLQILKTYEQVAIDLSEQIDRYEDSILLKTLKPPMLKRLYFMKRQAGIGKRLIMLTSDIIGFINTQEVEANTSRDIADQQLKLVNWFDQVLEDVVNLLNTFLTLSAHKTNDVMKTLTIFSVFFMPLTFIVGIYGMNFHYMPELSAKWGYPTVWLVMVLITLGIFFWVKRKHWI